MFIDANQIRAFVLIAVLGLAISGCHREKVHIAEITLSTGDTLIQENTYHPGWVEGVWTTRTLIRFSGSTREELLRDNSGPPLGLESSNAALWRKNGWIVIKIKRNLFFRRESDHGKWQEWELSSNPELFASVRSALLAAGEPFREDQDENRLRIHLGADYVFGIGEGYGEFSLPYEIESVDFYANKVTARRTTFVRGLPERIIFQGASSEFGGWTCHNIR